MFTNPTAVRRRAATNARPSKVLPRPAKPPADEGSHQPIMTALSNHLVVEQIPLDKLVPHQPALRVHPERQLVKLAAGIREFGFLVPILIDDRLRVITGHARVEAARRTGLSTVPAIRISHLNPTQVRAFRIADNRISELGTWDRHALALELKDLSTIDLDLNFELTGFEPAEIDGLIDELDGMGGADPEEEMPPVDRSDIVSQLGDQWRLGEHILLCGNALEPADYDRLMEGRQARLVFTDPPYNVPIDGHVSGLGAIRHREFVMASGEMSESQFTDFLTKSLRNLTRHAMPGAILYVCMDWRHLHELGVACRAADLGLLNICVWNKDNAGMGSFYRSKHELVFVLKWGEPKNLNNVQLGQFGRYRTNVWDYPGANTMRRGRLDDPECHPTVKPVALVSDAIRDASGRGELVLDAFDGSGTTLLAAERTGRIARVMELDPAYVDVCIRRWQKLTGKAAILSGVGIPFDRVAEVRRAGNKSDVTIAAQARPEPGGESAPGQQGGRQPASLTTANPLSALRPVRSRTRPGQVLTSTTRA